MIGYIYVTTNLLNGKKYVGRHCSIEFDRSYYGSGIHLKRSINKYGIENFSCELIDTADTYEDLVLLEMKYIKQFNAVESPDWYNNSYGGFNEGFVPGEKNIANRPDVLQKNREAHTGVHHSDEINKKKGRPGHAPTFTRKRTDTEKEESRKVTRDWNLSRSKEDYEKLSNHHKGSKMMTNGITQCWVYSNDIQNKLDDGWWFGSCKKRKKKATIDNSDRIKVIKDSKCKYVSEEELTSYMKFGWRVDK